jgi:hypothetical protein
MKGGNFVPGKKCQRDLGGFINASLTHPIHIEFILTPSK